MQFEDIFSTTKVDINLLDSEFIYFLVYAQEVVYVGQTSHGISRILMHLKHKKFDEIYMLKCAQEQLDEYEDFYIRKYRPKYNKRLNTKVSISLKTACNKLLDNWSSGFETSCSCSIPKMKKMLDYLDITPYEFHNNLYITESEYDLVNDTFEKFLMEGCSNEIFNIRI